MASQTQTDEARKGARDRDRAIREHDEAMQQDWRKIQSLARTALVEAGCHNPRFRGWRRRRMKELKRLDSRSVPATFTKVADATLGLVVTMMYNPAKRDELLETEKAVKDDIKARGTDLAGPGATPLTESLALNVAVFEHDLRLRQAICAPGQTCSEIDHRTLDRAMKRYLQAAKLLAMVQKLNLPNVQINVGRNQVITQVSGPSVSKS
jgi:hypothetical protein